MRSLPMAIVLAMSGGCGRVAFDLRDDVGDAGADGSVDALVLGPWTPPTLVVLPTNGDDDDPSLTADRLELYFNRAGNQIFRSVRSTTTTGWGVPALVPELSAIGANTMPEVSADGLRVYWTSSRGGGVGGLDIYSASRAQRTDAWTGILNQTPLNTTSDDYGGSQTSDQLRAMISSLASGNFDIYEATRASAGGPWSTPVVQPNLSSGALEDEPFLTEDGLTLYYTGPGDDLHVTTRSSVTQPFPAGTPIVELLSAGQDLDPWVSADGRYIMFASDRSGASRLYESTR